MRLMLLFAVIIAGCLAPGPSATTPLPPAPDETPVVFATGHIEAGTPTTRVRSLTVLTDQDGYDSFRFSDPPVNRSIATMTTDGGGLGFNVDIYFHDAKGVYLGGCATGPEEAQGQKLEEICDVPEGATQGTVDAVFGRDLTVQLLIMAST